MSLKLYPKGEKVTALLTACVCAGAILRSQNQCFNFQSINARKYLFAKHCSLLKYNGELEKQQNSVLLLIE